MGRLSRLKNAGATRDDILAAAPRRFAAESYDAVGLREVAREAGIDVALISRYFGSKEELFKKALVGRPNDICFGGRRNVSDLADWLAGLALDDGDSLDYGHLERLYIILRSASSPATARIVSNSFCR